MAQGSEVKTERKIYGRSNVEWKINARMWGKLGRYKDTYREKQNRWKLGEG